MQSKEATLFTLILFISLAEFARCYPVDIPDSDAGDSDESRSTFYDINHDGGGHGSVHSHHHNHHQHPHQNRHNQQQATAVTIDYYEYRHIFAAGVGKALDECRQKFKWDRWNCPKKAFLSILDREEFPMSHDALPANKELGLTRSLISSSIVLSMIRSCSYGTSRLCHCANPVAVSSTATVQPQHNLGASGSINNSLDAVDAGLTQNHPSPTKFKRTAVQVQPVHHNSLLQVSSGSARFAWAGCEEIVRFGFKVARMYLDSQDNLQDAASRLINAHNFKAGRQAVRRLMKRKCKCHGVSGTCQMNTCWTVVPSMAEIGDYLKRQYHVAAKVGAISVKETSAERLGKELSALSKDKLVFADVSPDYCYEHKPLGINGTLNRYCSRTKYRADGTEVSRSERDSCDRLCTKCGYKVHKELIRYDKQCNCRFVFCCSIECERCPQVEEAFKCSKHS